MVNVYRREDVMVGPGRPPAVPRVALVECRQVQIAT